MGRFVSLMLVVHVTCDTARHSARDRVMVCIMACDTADHGTPYAALGRGRGRASETDRNCKDESSLDATHVWISCC